MIVLIAGDLQVTFHAQHEEILRVANRVSAEHYSGGSSGGVRDGEGTGAESICTSVLPAGGAWGATG